MSNFEGVKSPTESQLEIVKSLLRTIYRLAQENAEEELHNSRQREEPKGHTEWHFEGNTDFRTNEFAFRNGTNNFFVIDGERGTGKSTTLEMVRYCAQYLGKKTPPHETNLLKKAFSDSALLAPHFPRELNNCSVEIFPTIYPEMFAARDTELPDILFDRIREDLERHAGQDAPEVDHFPPYLASQAQDYKRDHSFQHRQPVFSAKRKRNAQALLDRLKKEVDPAWTYARNIGREVLARDSINYSEFVENKGRYSALASRRQELWREFLNDYLDYRGARLLLITLDDCDLTPHIAQQLMSDLRHYLNHPRVVVINALNLEALENVLRAVEFGDAMPIISSINALQGRGISSTAQDGSTTQSVSVHNLEYIHEQLIESIIKVFPPPFRYNILPPQPKEVANLFLGNFLASASNNLEFKSSKFIEGSEYNLFFYLWKTRYLSVTSRMTLRDLFHISEKLLEHSRYYKHSEATPYYIKECSELLEMTSTFQRLRRGLFGVGGVFDALRYVVGIPSQARAISFSDIDLDAGSIDEGDLVDHLPVDAKFPPFEKSEVFELFIELTSISETIRLDPADSEVELFALGAFLLQGAGVHFERFRERHTAVADRQGIDKFDFLPLNTVFMADAKIVRDVIVGQKLDIVGIKRYLVADFHDYLNLVKNIAGDQGFNKELISIRAKKAITEVFERDAKPSFCQFEMTFNRLRGAETRRAAFDAYHSLVAYGGLHEFIMQTDKRALESIFDNRNREPVWQTLNALLKRTSAVRETGDLTEDAFYKRAWKIVNAERASRHLGTMFKVLLSLTIAERAISSANIEDDETLKFADSIRTYNQLSLEDLISRVLSHYKEFNRFRSFDPRDKLFLSVALVDIVSELPGSAASRDLCSEIKAELEHLLGEDSGGIVNPLLEISPVRNRDTGRMLDLVELARDLVRIAEEMSEVKTPRDAKQLTELQKTRIRCLATWGGLTGRQAEWLVRNWDTIDQDLGDPFDVRPRTTKKSATTGRPIRSGGRQAGG